ncbi:uncharacterized protein LOC134775924 [Penaeus indicus]|uniref:uncharacterized protein LOC134775924 n=1 Tax=Penaeus indicus TaxID=29960 RepID=UPI00300C1BB7
MAGWRRLVVAALLQLACSRALSTESNCYEEGELSQGRGYFYCLEPRLNFKDTSKNLLMDFRNKNKNNVFGLSLNRTADAFHIITMKDSETINSTKFDLRNSSSELHLNIDRSSVLAKTHGTWRKLDIPETNQIFSLYIRISNPPFCITCNGEDIWQNERDTSQSTEQGDAHSIQSTEQGDAQSTQSTEQGDAQSTQSTEQGDAQSTQSTEQGDAQSTQNTEQGDAQSTQSTEQGDAQSTQSTEQGDAQSTQSTEQGMKQSPEATEQSETGKLWPLCFILLPILGLLLYKRKYLCGKMQLLCQALRTCCHKTNEAESEQEMPGHFHQAVHVKGEFEAGQVVREEVETENDMYISADHFQRSEAGLVVREEVETENDMYISADHFQRS